MTMSRAVVIPSAVYLVLASLLLVAKERYGWSNEAIGWPALILIGGATVAHLLLREREEAARAKEEAAEADSSPGAAARDAQLAATRNASSST